MAVTRRSQLDSHGCTAESGLDRDGANKSGSGRTNVAPRGGVGVE